MTDRYTKGLLTVIAVASTLLLTSCSNPDTSGGVTLSKDPHPKNAPFPHGACNDDHAFDERDTGCGWINGYFIKPGADLSYANLMGVDLSGANLSGANLTFTELNHANLTGATMDGVKITSDTSCFYTICPNKQLVVACGNCGF